MHKDFDKLYTPREATALYNLNKIKFNPCSYTLKENLVFHTKLSDVRANHIMSYEYDTERTLVHELIKAGYTPGVNLDTLFTSEESSTYVTCADTAIMKDTNMHIALEYLKTFAGLDVSSLKGTPFMNALVRMAIALNSNESCSNEMYWLMTHLGKESFEDLHNFKPLKNALESKGELPLRLAPGVDAESGIYVPAAATADDCGYPALASDRFKAALKYKARLYTLEVLWAYERLNDEDLKRALSSAMFRAGPSHPCTDDIYSIMPSGLEYPEHIEKLIRIENAKERFEAYREYFESDTIHQTSVAGHMASEYPKYFENPIVGMFTGFAQSCAVTNVRINNIRILYTFAKEKGLLPDDIEDTAGLNVEEERAFKDMVTEALGDALKTPAEEAPSHKSLMDLDKGKCPKSGMPSTTESHDTAVYEALDALKASFKSDRYSFNVEDVRVTDDSVKTAYNAVCSKVTLLNKSLIRRIKAIKTYNVGGKNPGQRTGKLDRKAMYRYKSTPDIFYNNTYKQLESDLAFGVILDISGSMHGKGIENGRITMIILHETLKALGINHCILGHTCYGGMYRCDIERYQSFREDATYTVCKNYALANLRARSGNCDSGALHYMEKAMERVHNRDKIVLMFSDGAPTECTGTDLIEQVKNMERKGIKVIGIGINFPNISKYYTDYANGRNLQDMLNIVSLILEEYVLKKKDV